MIPKKHVPDMIRDGNRFSEKEHAQSAKPFAGRQRVDKWLWHARMVRTRSDAAALADAGYVRINGKRITASSHKVAIGDVVTLALDHSVKVVQVEGFCQRRGQASAGRALYFDLTMNSGAGASSAISRKAVPK